MPFATMAFFKISAAYRADMACRSYQINIQLETDEEKQFLNSLLTKGTIISQNATLELLSSLSNIALKLQCNSLINYIIDYTNSIPTSV
ncbi:hypothetical protein TVAG_366280 [Trichomonas vaginalis G3]|uniref:Uncharacterized protein n=1 Tax=Trichomonas vaginalis (strain ATCC PRA-98 / G3) TaxID=412133 RepID=A2DHS2_TRIV3|nr:hypothetical protein TVAGG3_0303400 [Trichomonas vaginalis G3]EAY20120.1 hypothetical protein TVAG_366280 [Trichomonas vaginalis G3]KAI5528073.1 hypothetical protein TVAGG3_0303400 [Trichomonas vaginalis G3]|eukprot:XP_001581106.1 hypothetical protein [Trichomonas vaginalis G3]